MLSRSFVQRASALRNGLRALSAAAAPAVQASSVVDPEHKAWLATVAKYPVVIPKFEWTLEWALPTPVPMHQFEQSPVVIEVTDRNSKSDDLVFFGPDVVGGYTHPVTGELMTTEKHEAMQAAEKAKAAAAAAHSHSHAGHGHSHGY